MDTTRATAFQVDNSLISMTVKANCRDRNAEPARLGGLVWRTTLRKFEGQTGIQFPKKLIGKPAPLQVLANLFPIRGLALLYRLFQTHGIVADDSHRRQEQPIAISRSELVSHDGRIYRIDVFTFAFGYW